MKKLSAIVAVAALSCSVIQAEAVPITFTFEATGTNGYLNGTRFTDKDLKIVVTGDTDDIETVSSLTKILKNNITATFELEGFASGQFEEGFRIVSTTGPNGTIGFTAQANNSVRMWMLWSGHDYDLASDVTLERDDFNSLTSPSGLMDTVGAGDGLRFTSSTSPARLTARIEQPAEVPEPATMALLALGLAGVGGSRLRQRPRTA